ncbi:transposase family protein [Ectobacillus funiculus]|uniref:Transposase family protein n=1 Tax=Ectobacillus funiculus TaxID=137993 RepID=A0ABV5WBI1_9BACI
MIFLRIKSSRCSAACTTCQHVSTRKRIFYYRVVKDLPVGDRAVYLRVQIRKWFYTDPI